MAKDRFGIERPFVDDGGTGPFNIQRPFVQVQKMKLHGELQRFVEDESKAGGEYEYTSEMAEDAGYPGIANKLRRAAKDERKHNEWFIEAVQKLERDIDG